VNCAWGWPWPLAATMADDQERLKEEALQQVKVQAFQMKRSLDGDKLMEALKHASNMICELRTSMLSPKSYYELYMAISDELRHLGAHLIGEFQRGKKANDLYELVQYAGNIIPRLYLLVTVGTVYIKTKQVPTKDILKDLVEMCRGVQHPLRGLFLRDYLLKSIKGDLPDTHTDANHGSLQDSIDFILLNFSEMNKLWVRMQHQGHSRNRAEREKQRRELKILVGTNLARLSELEGLNVKVYKESILPALMVQIVGCKDAIAQEYLMECIIQVFNDSLHLQTLGVFIEGCGALQPKVNVKNIIISLIDRLADFSLENKGEVEDADIPLFEIFSEQISNVVAARPEMPIEDVVAMQVSLANLATKCYKGELGFVDQILEYTAKALKSHGKQNFSGEFDVLASTAVSKPLMRLMRMPLETGSVTTALQLEHYAPLLAFLAYDLRKMIGVAWVEALVSTATVLETPEQVEGFLGVINPLIVDQDDQPAGEVDEEDFSEEQCLVGRFITLLRAETNDTQFIMLSLLKKRLGEGGEQRLKRTLPAIVFQALQLVRMYYDAGEDSDANWGKKMKKIYTFCHQLITALATAGEVNLALRLYLQTAMAADYTQYEGSENVVYEFVTQAYSLYEDEVSSSKEQMDAVALILGTLERIRSFSLESFNPAGSKAAMVASKLMRKADQVKGVCICSFIFWANREIEEEEEMKKGKRVLQCLQKALKVANSCMDPTEQVALFVEIFNYYVVYFEKGAEQITTSMLTKIKALIDENIDKVEGAEAEIITKSYANLLDHIKVASSDKDSRSFDGFEL